MLNIHATVHLSRNAKIICSLLYTSLYFLWSHLKETPKQYIPAYTECSHASTLFREIYVNYKY